MFINLQTRALHASEGDKRDVRALLARNHPEGRYHPMKRHALTQSARPNRVFQDLARRILATCSTESRQLEKTFSSLSVVGFVGGEQARLRIA